MTSIDYRAVLADLADKRAAIDQIIGGVRRLVGDDDGSQPAAPIAAIARGGGHDEIHAPKSVGRGSVKKSPKTAAQAGTRTKSPARPGGRLSLAPEQMGRIRDQYESGKSVVGIAKGAGIGPGMVYYHASVRGWKRPKGAMKPERARERVTDVLSLGRGDRLCAHCGARTTKDPCNVCGNPARKTPA